MIIICFGTSSSDRSVTKNALTAPVGYTEAAPDGRSTKTDQHYACSLVTKTDHGAPPSPKTQTRRGVVAQDTAA